MLISIWKLEKQFEVVFDKDIVREEDIWSLWGCLVAMIFALFTHRGSSSNDDILLNCLCSSEETIT